MLDTNIIIDIALEREPFKSDALRDIKDYQNIENVKVITANKFTKSYLK
jgi:predicted nucleic acid-binding protein